MLLRSFPKLPHKPIKVRHLAELIGHAICYHIGTSVTSVIILTPYLKAEETQLTIWLQRGHLYLQPKEMDTRERLIDIALHWEQTEFTCKQCGTITPTKDILEPVFVESNKSYQLYCADCGSFITNLKQSKKFRIFMNKDVGMIDIEELDTDYLQWMLKVNHSQIKGDNMRLAIEDVIKRRTTDPGQFKLFPDEEENPLK